MIIDGVEYFLIPVEDLHRYIGEEILIYSVVEQCSYYEVVDSIEIDEEENSIRIHYNQSSGTGRDHLWVREHFWSNPDEWYLPYTKTLIDSTGKKVDKWKSIYCRCGGPGEDRRCFDTFSVERICVRCHKRKVG